MINARQLETFRQNTLDYFAKLAQGADLPLLGDAFLSFDPPQFLDHAAAVEISGPLTGLIYLTAPSATLDKLLELNGATPGVETLRLDMCRELSNILAGNASRAFGPAWTISVPRSLSPDSLADLNFPGASFTLPITWMGQTLHLVVGLIENSHE